jgi:carbon monoxide dehydrogenase subunit G
MHLEGEFTVQADQKKAYQFLVDPDLITRSMPDVQEVEIEDENNFTVKAKVGISHIRGTMVMKLRIAEKKEPVSAKVVGQGAGMASVVDMTTIFTLEKAGEGETRITWSGEMKVGGKLASFGAGGLMERVAKKNLEKFVSGIQEGIEAIKEEPGA